MYLETATPLVKTTKESSCATCRLRKLRCTGGRPACEQCLKSSSFQGFPREGILCLYSASSKFARREDVDLEVKLGKANHCLWTKEVKGDLATEGESCERMEVDEGQVKDEGEIGRAEKSSEEDNQKRYHFFPPPPRSLAISISSSSLAPSSVPDIESSPPTSPESVPMDLDDDESLLPKIDWDRLDSPCILDHPLYALNTPLPPASPVPVPVSNHTCSFSARL